MEVDRSGAGDCGTVVADSVTATTTTTTKRNTHTGHCFCCQRQRPTKTAKGQRTARKAKTMKYNLIPNVQSTMPVVPGRTEAIIIITSAADSQFGTKTTLRASS